MVERLAASLLTTTIDKIIIVSMANALTWNVYRIADR